MKDSGETKNNDQHAPAPTADLAAIAVEAVEKLNIVVSDILLDELTRDQTDPLFKQIILAALMRREGERIDKDKIIEEALTAPFQDPIPLALHPYRYREAPAIEKIRAQLSDDDEHDGDSILSRVERMKSACMAFANWMIEHGDKAKEPLPPPPAKGEGEGER